MAWPNFGSTVSKILRQRDKYINLPPLEDVVSPGRKSKAKLPDFEKTLANWVRNQQKKGVPVSDGDLKRQAKVFSFSRSDQALLSSTSWLEKFKQKNQLGRYADNATDSTVTTGPPTSPVGSPASSVDVKLQLPALDEVTGARDDSEHFFDFDVKSEDFVDDPSMEASPFSDDVVREDDILPELPANSTFTVPSSSKLNRQRSQTISNVEDYAGGPSRTKMTAIDSAKPPITRALTTSLTLYSHTGIDPVMTVKRHKSVPDIHEDLDADDSVHFAPMHAPPLPHPPRSPSSASVSPVSETISPVDNDHIKALREIMKVLEENPGYAGPEDFLAIGKLMEKMKLIKSPIQSNASLAHGIASDGKGKKRGYVGIS